MISVTDAPDGKKKVTVSIYAANAANAQSVADSWNTLTEGELSNALLGIASVTPDSKKAAAVQVTTHAAPSSPLASPPPSVLALARAAPPALAARWPCRGRHAQVHAHGQGHRHPPQTSRPDHHGHGQGEGAGAP